jgi:hypothetical protein
MNHMVLRADCAQEYRASTRSRRWDEPVHAGATGTELMILGNISKASIACFTPDFSDYSGKWVRKSPLNRLELTNGQAVH